MDKSACLPSQKSIEVAGQEKAHHSIHTHTHTGIEPSTSHTISLMAAWRHGMECMGLWADAVANDADQEKAVSAAAAAAYWKELASFRAARCIGMAWNALAGPI